ncbi:MAG: LysM peptidoglycan-binding domain-containing protein [Candidatus Nanopelagicaceae bacterium]|nr:LysM peptidoglycan-binding domain-containing protein [Candidatus Nanopelagicaceae bacterium]
MSAIALQHPSLPRLGLNRRGRLARFLVVLSLMVVLGAGFAMKAGAGNSVNRTPVSYVTVVVAPGESLWSIATDAAGSGDLRAMVDEIMSANSLSTPDVAAGQVLRVPA